VFIAVSLATTLLAGCITSVLITEETIIEPSGAAQRSVLISVMTDGKDVEEAKEALEKSVLPKGPGWESEIKRAKNGYLFLANARFDRIGSTPFDEYLRKPITFKLIRGFPFIRYEYSEDFASLLDLRVSVTAEIIETTVMEELDQIAGPIPPDRWEGLRKEIRRIVESIYKGKDNDKIEAEFRKAIETALGDRLADSSFKAIRKKVEQALSEREGLKLEEMGLVGIVEFHPEYRITLQMPGEVIETNGEIDGNVVIWQVDEERYNLGGFKAYAYSRRLNLPALILVLVVVIAAIMAGVTLKIRHTSS
jgi:hypothetical protein